MSSPILNNESDSKIRVLSDAEAVEFFDKQVRSLLHISAEEFLARRAKGEYKDACDNPKVLKLLMMIPKALANCDHK